MIVVTSKQMDRVVCVSSSYSDLTLPPDSDLHQGQQLLDVVWWLGWIFLTDAVNLQSGSSGCNGALSFFTVVVGFSKLLQNSSECWNITLNGSNQCKVPPGDSNENFSKRLIKR